ncbi:MAG TPA: class I SAM-dependent methyltransferase [Candidatus Acidoferrales bacterium]|jgi:SAM-dependent methyltransferase|nr:class I SAM-dependent methyltransferase [Candidatus Acidoferrales bacterium]
MMLATDSKQRFSNRVEDYVRYRPGYPRAVLDLLCEECGFAPESVVADIGSGTGILTQMLLENGNVVHGVEPNAEMRAAGENFLQKYARFHSVVGSAENTTLPDASVDFVVVGQAFHWFEPKAARAEFERVLKPRGFVAVIWNERKQDRTAFLREYESFLRVFCADYERISEKYPQDRPMRKFFGAGAGGKKSFANEQVFDFVGLRGRLLSSSYAPPQGHPQHEPMLAALEKLFAAHARDGRVRFEYLTHVYYGQLESLRGE